MRADICPSAILTEAAFANALLVLAAVGGSTNAVVHLCAIAGRRGIRLPLEAFDAASRAVPVLVDVAPIGRHPIAAFDAAGGLPVLLASMEDLLHNDVLTVEGRPALVGRRQASCARRHRRDPSPR